ncbi:MAG: hypothetical protein M1812_006910 [Candelaria pacifica]|nr:MAG: hypothetical protein M1812_006910 [Candelaria pacifica]
MRFTAHLVVSLTQLIHCVSTATASVIDTGSVLRSRNVGTSTPYCSDEYGSPKYKDCIFAIKGLQQYVQGNNPRYAYSQMFGERGSLGIDQKYQLPYSAQYGTCTVDVSINLYERYVEEASWLMIINTLQEIVKQCVKPRVIFRGGLFKTGLSLGLICRIRRRDPEVHGSTTSLYLGTSIPNQESAGECDWRAFLHTDYPTEAEITACANGIGQVDIMQDYSIFSANLRANEAEDLSDASIVCALALCLTDGPKEQCCSGFLCASRKLAGANLVFGVLEGLFSIILGTCEPDAAQGRHNLDTLNRPLTGKKIHALRRRFRPESQCEPYYGSPSPDACRAAVLLMTSQTWIRSDYAAWQLFGFPVSPDVGDDMHLPRSYQVGDCVFSIHINLYEGEKDHASFKNIVNSGESLIRRCVKSVLFKSGGFDRIGSLGRIVVKIHWAPPVVENTVQIAQSVMTQNNQNLRSADALDCIYWVDGEGNAANDEPSCSTQYSVPGSSQYQALAGTAGVSAASGDQAEDLEQAAETCPSKFCIPGNFDCCPFYTCIEKPIQDKWTLLGVLNSITGFAVGSCVGLTKS